MNKSLLYHTSMAVCGGVFGLIGVSSLFSEGIGLGPMLMTVGGTGMVLSTVYIVVSSNDLSDSVPDGGTVWIAVAGAVLAVVGGLSLIVES
ncbi:MAG: hypothetical protein QXG03_02840 [Halalkalicoccus sp.]